MSGLFIRILMVATLTAQMPAQGPNPSQTTGASIHSQYFSGYVAELSGGSLTVTRKGTNGRELLRRIFHLDSQTKIEGKIHPNARVTVRFESTPEGDRAVRIIVRG